MSIATRKGDDGTTGLLYGGRVRKDSPRPEAYGQVDEAQAVLGLARAHAEPGGELDGVLVGVQRDLWVLMADLATDVANRSKLVAGASLVTTEMVTRLDDLLAHYEGRFEMPKEFVVPGASLVGAHLDVARTVVRRAERVAVALAPESTAALAYLNRLSDLLWALARWQDGTSQTARQT
ncbi:cob(I)yrinic acid a,c-diamide adenosyltransferase [Iamia sp. SCSIO 61187]|uniref:cob(I)yrinic acid a,c-diamide adenosyltransferase n=1 Tax=Iamia sp. SCSIO 61187 TaxID=2722752 RepID=UPI001C62B2DF|nr:cob(I)yrinic acid a,c-diamide adenosyltransferase [Iamia sp. SCSIO 61187]QYG92382.1 cob(I)yrinic acid a,c-diamide adenosyltransferase [Iamia sp. SCSIO 61187]